MGRVTTPTQFEIEVEEVMRKYGVNRGEAGVIVGNLHGDLTNDIEYVPPLTEKERKELGVGKTIRESMAERGELEDAER
jgi:hypothetical protein